MLYAQAKEFDDGDAMYLFTGEIKRLVVEWTGMLAEFHHSYNDIDRFNSYCDILDHVHTDEAVGYGKC